MTFQFNRRSALKAGITLSTLAALPSCAGSTITSAPTDAQLAMIDAKMKEHRAPGLGVAMIEDGVVAWEQGFGFRNLDTQAPVDEKTLFQAASLSKPIFAYVVLKAIENGELSFDDRLTEFVRPDDLDPGPWSDQITVRDVLQHTAGLPNWRDDENGPQPLVPAYEPGTDTSYSGEAFFWLQKCMEEITGHGLNTFMSERLFEPAGLTDMRMLWEPGERAEREVYGHIFDDDDRLVVSELQYKRVHSRRLIEVAEKWGKPMHLWTAEDQVRAAGEMRPHTNERLKMAPAWIWGSPGHMLIDSASSLRCTPGDYARFMCSMMPDRKRKAWEFSEETRQLMLTPQYERPDVQNGVLPRGLGWGLEKRDSGTACYHWGKNGSSHHSVALADPTTGRGIVLMTNGPNGKALIPDVATALLGVNYIAITT
ncbi:MAG: serine hydrolase domain-containing protein [Pseudomonadota bacterium]